MFELLEYFREDGRKLELIMNNWAHMDAPSGLTYNVSKGSYDKGSSSTNLWDHKLHPKDMYDNLILPTFDNINFISQAKFSLLQKVRIFIPPFLSSYRFVCYDFAFKYKNQYFYINF